MADARNDNNAFSRAFLPGLILGLVVGGLCGAILPDIVAGASRPDFSNDGHANGSHTGERNERPPVDDADPETDLDADAEAGSETDDSTLADPVTEAFEGETEEDGAASGDETP